MRKEEKRKAGRSAFARVLKYLKSSLPLILLTLFLAFVTVAFTLYVPILVGDAIDCILDTGVDFASLKNYLIGIGACALVTAASQWLMSVVNNTISYNTVKKIREDAFLKIQKLPFSYIDNHSYGDVANRVVADVDLFADGLLMGFTQLFTGVLTIVGTIVFMLKINWMVAAAVAVVTPLSLFVAKFIATHTFSMFAAQSKTRGEQTAFIDEMIGNLKVVKAFSHEGENEEKFDEINARLKDCSLKAIFFSSLTNPCTRFVNAVVYALVALLGAIFVIMSAGSDSFLLGGMTVAGLTVGGLSKFLSYATQYTKPFNEISGVVTEFQNALACASRIFELIDAEPQKDDSDLPEMGRACGEVTLEKVNFSYTPDKKLIENFSLQVKSGQRVAIVGPTGCGKTTVVNLLMRFYDVDEGRICVDRKDVREITRRSLRKNYGMVLQETWLKNGTVRENIAMGKPDATDEEIVAAAKAAHAHSFIVRLKDGYDTVVGEEGGSLSQGQKQLLCITRIMLGSPPMLILDEATSSIDTRTELKIQEDFAKMTKGRTSFIVAHRLSTIRSADVILVMKDGRIVEQGKHDELLSKGGFYSLLYNSQFAN